MKRQGLVLSALALAATSVVFPPPAPAAVSVGHSGWSWGNPRPQGQTIRSLDFIGARGYAAGEFGTLLRSDDGGATWTGLATGLTDSLADVTAIDADSVALVAGRCAVRRSDDAGQSFSRLPWTASDRNCSRGVSAVTFPTDQIGYLGLTDRTVLRTADGGRTWSRRAASPDGTPTDMAFTSADVGVAVTSTGRIYRTSDGATSWTLVQTHSPGGFGDVFKDVLFVGSTTGYAVGRSSSVFKTTDGGASWADKSPSGGLNLTGIACGSPANCVATVEGGSELLRTTDGADSFSPVTPSTDRVRAVAFTSTTGAVAAGDSGSTVISADAGATWSAVGGRLTAQLTQISATSSALAFAGGRSGALVKTTDGGNTWSRLGVLTSGDVLDVSFPTRSTGFALDSGGGVVRTDNGGASWKILNTGTSARPRAILAVDTNVILLIGPRGIRRSTDGGGEFSKVRSRAVAKASLLDADRAGGSLVVYGPKSLAVSRNKGRTWRKVRRPRSRLLAAVDFVSSRRGFALGRDGRVWKTGNRGRRWRDLPSIGTDRAYTLAFSGTSNGYLVLSRFGSERNGYLLRTSDGGKTWRPQLVASTQINGLATAGSTSYALAGNSWLLATTTGGDAGATSTLKLKTRRRTLRRRGKIKIAGRLRPASGGEQVVVSIRRNGRAWSHKTVTVASNGSFTTTWRVRRSAIFIAQWLGDERRMGDGSRPLTVKVKRRRR